MGKMYKDETTIRIPENTLVLLCGSQCSGKTTFAQKHFAGKKIIATDEIFEQLVYEASPEKDTFESLASRTCEIFAEKVMQSSKENTITVVDAAPIDFDGRQMMLEQFKGLHKNVILIVLDVKFSTLIERPKKKINKKKKSFGITAVSDMDLMFNSLLIMKQTQNDQFAYKVNKAYILSEKKIDSCQIIFE